MRSGGGCRRPEQPQPQHSQRVWLCGTLTGRSDRLQNQKLYKHGVHLEANQQPRRNETCSAVLGDVLSISLDTAGERNGELEDEWRKLPRTP